MWALNNPHNTRQSAAQPRFTAYAWADIMGDSLLDQYVIPLRLDSDKYLVFLEELPREILTNVLTPVQQPHMVSTGWSSIPSWKECNANIWTRHSKHGDWAWWSRRLSCQIP
ncbi:hypothetical protein TNCV_1600511 [Trichonephila clavipes]|nr:hypothetical protein TNCV_1600511 [Trichonephila clavipes]